MSTTHMKKFRISNTTHLSSGPTGHMLDYEGKLFAPGRVPIVIEAETLPPLIEAWQGKGWVRVTDAVSGDVVGMDVATQPIVTAGTRVHEADPRALDEHEFPLEDEVGFDPQTAREADLSVGAHAPNTQQMPENASRARISLGMEEEPQSLEGLSPIPGDRPRNVDDTDKFTIRAPRNTSVGGVIPSR